MDRLEKMRPYVDRLPADDAKWLVAEVERLRAGQAYDRRLRTDALRRATKAEAELARLRGETAQARCPCGFPDDHAGWCPRQGGGYAG